MKEPKIRFKGFRGEWEETPLLDVVTLYNGLTYTPNVIRDHGTLVLRSSNVQEGEISLFDNVYVRSEVATSPNVKKGDIIVVVRNGSRTLIGKHAQIKSDMPNTVIGAFMAGMHTDEPEFLNALLCTRRFDNEVTINLGATINQITNGTFHSMKFLFPDKKEQKALGSYFQHLDALIQSTTKKIESLKQVKAASLQSMFPQEGETTPRVRFKGFEGEWEKVTIKDVATFLKGRGYSKSDLRVKGTPIILYGRIYTKYEACITNVDTYVNPLPNSIYTLGNEVVIPASGETPEDISCASAIKVRGIILGGDLNILRFDTDCYDTTFVAFLLSNGKAKKDLSNMAQGKSVVHLHNSDIEKVDMFIPSFVEQQQIASYFTNLDRQITLQTQRLEKLKQIKSACLDNMFV